MVKAEQFVGVKIAHFGPVALVGGYLVARLMGSRSALRSPVTWLQGAVCLVILAAVALMAVRTGNENPSAVSDLELRLRSFLEAFFLVRPRTKEFLIGHPALFAGIALLAANASWGVGVRPTWVTGMATLLLTLGAIGQTSIVNTLCHLHTPLAVGLARVGVGLVVGGIIGALVWAFARRYARTAES
jgi:hypothetical protein